MRQINHKVKGFKLFLLDKTSFILTVLFSGVVFVASTNAAAITLFYYHHPLAFILWQSHFSPRQSLLTNSFSRGKIYLPFLLTNRSTIRFFFQWKWEKKGLCFRRMYFNKRSCSFLLIKIVLLYIYHEVDWTISFDCHRCD